MTLIVWFVCQVIIEKPLNPLYVLLYFGHFIDGSTYADFRDYRNYLATHDDRLARAFAGKLLTFATGRELGFSDRAELDRIVADTAQNKHRLRDLLHRIIQSEIFLNK